MNSPPALVALGVIATAFVLAVLLGVVTVTAGAVWVLRSGQRSSGESIAYDGLAPPPVWLRGPAAAAPSPWTASEQPPSRAQTHAHPGGENAASAVDLGDRTKGGEPEAQRAALLAGLVELRGLLDDDLSATLLTDTLRGGGVTVIDPAGARLDPQRHRVDHTVTAPDPSWDGLIAETLAPCYIDGDRVLRAADVVVYRWSRS